MLRFRMYGAAIAKGCAGIFIAAAISCQSALPSNAMTLKDVQSFVYAIGSGTGEQGFPAAVAGSPSQLIIAGGFGLREGSQYHRDNIDPTHSRLVFRYVDVTESTAYTEPDAYANGARPSYAANPVGFYDLYTVRYWMPEWKAVLHQEIDAVIANGYDGVLLDVLYGDQYWVVGNLYGNTPYSNATSDLASLAADLISYVKNKNLTKPFYVMGADPHTLAEQYPSIAKDLDGIFLDSLYYNVNVKGEYLGPGGIGAGLYESRVTPYKVLGLPVFGADYPPPGDQKANLDAFKYFTAKGWVPTINPETQDFNVLTTGPFMFMATPTNTTVKGAANFSNFISGGLAANAALIGGDKDDVFIGGIGENTISGGVGDDTVYAHPDTSKTKNNLKIVLQGDVHNVAPPTISIFINGKAAISAATVTGTFQNSQTQTIEIDTTKYEPVTEIKFTANVPNYVNATTFANIQVQSVEYQAQSVSFEKATFAANSSSLEKGMRAIMNPGQNTIVLGTGILPIAAPAFASAADSIDGGPGANTVVYRVERANYTLAPNADGSITITSGRTNEGPDTLRNIQFIKFSDITIRTQSLETGALFSSTNPTSLSFLRFYNTGTSAGSVSVTLRDYVSGNTYGQWTSPSIPAGGEIQYGIVQLEDAIGTITHKPAYYAASIDSGISGAFQHVLYRPADGTLTNLSTCASNVFADPSRISGVHSAIVSASGFPSSIVIHNTGPQAAASLGIYDARDGSRLGTYPTASIAANGQLTLPVATLEAGIGLTPTGSLGHYVIKLENAFNGFIQNLVNNTKAGVVTDMTTACALDGSTSATASAIEVGAVSSSTQSTALSFLRFFNTSAAAAPITAVLRDAATGQSLGQWTSPSIPAGAAAQYPISQIETDLGIGTKPSTYRFSLTQAPSGYLQHVVVNPNDGTLTNLSTCSAGVTSDATTLNAVHSSLVGGLGYPSTLVIANEAAAGATVTLGIYDESTGSKLGTYQSASIAAHGLTLLSVGDIEAAAHIPPSDSIGHYIVRVESPFTGFLQHLVNNQKAGVITDMTTVCAVQ